MNRILFNTQFEGSIPIVSEYQSLLDAVVASPAAVPVQHTNLIGIVTRTSWLRRRKGPVQEALDRLAGKAATTSDGKRTVEFQIITAEDRLDVHKLDNTHSQMLADIGEYIRVNVDLAAPGGQDYAHDLINRPQVFSEDVKGADGVIRKRVHFNGRPMHFAGWYFQKAFFVAIMTTKSGQNVFDLSGTEVVIASKKEALAACKRIRRDFAHNAMFFDGKLAGKPVPSGTAFAVASLTAKAILAWRWGTAAGDSLSLVLPLRYAVPWPALLRRRGLAADNLDHRSSIMRSRLMPVSSDLDVVYSFLLRWPALPRAGMGVID